MNKFAVVAMLMAACVVSRAEEGKAKAVEFGGDTKYSMAVPESWTATVPEGGMRKLEVKVPKVGADTEDASIAVFIFAGGGGGKDANIKRWAGQFGGEDSIKANRTLKTAKGEAAIVEIEGTYKGMNPATGGATDPKENFKLLGAIIGDVFIKLTGPKATIEASRAAFDKMIESFK